MPNAISELTRAMISFGAYTLIGIIGVFSIIVIISCVRAMLNVRP